MKLLLVEDEDRVAEIVRRGLVEEGHQVDVCGNGRAALDQARDIDYDVIVLDWMLPGIDGLELLRQWRAGGLRTPVLMLTARGHIGERVTGLKSGADDYLVKPFDFAELVARIEALHRRGSGQIELRRAGDVHIDGRRRVLVRDAGDGATAEAPLTAREYALCQELFSHVGDVLSRSHLLAAVWGTNYEGDPNVLDVYIGYLRAKLARIASTRVTLRNLRGVGFRLEVGGA
jgi:DNA-binding response OmpR family regulator